MLEDHIVGEILGFGRLELLALYAKVTPRGGELKDLIALLGDFGCREGNEGANTRTGGDERHELGVEKFDGIGLPRKEGVDNFFRDGKSLLGIGVLSTLKDFANGVFPTLEVGGALLADEDHVAIDALGLEVLEPGLGLLDHEGVVASAKTAITGDDDEGDLVHLALGQEGEVGGLSAKPGDKSTEYALESFREGTGGQDSVLGATDLGSGDELHGRGDFFGIVDGFDTIANGVGLAVHDDGGPTSSVGGIVADEDIVKTRRSNGGESSRAGGESTSGGKSRGGNAKELHGCVGYWVELDGAPVGLWRRRAAEQLGRGIGRGTKKARKGRHGGLCVCSTPQLGINVQTKILVNIHRMSDIAWTLNVGVSGFVRVVLLLARVELRAIQSPRYFEFLRLCARV